MLAILPHDDEARLVREFFGGGVGFFVDVGAHDPKINSQSWHLEQAGWSGILVEPQPDLAERLRKERRAEVFAVACSSRLNSGRSMQLNLDGPYSSLNRSSVVAGRRPVSIIAVPVQALDEILENAKAPAPLDFLSIDVEGHTQEVLDGIDLPRWRPRLILIEDHVMNLRIHRHMIAQGYRWVRRTGLNSWYVPAENAPTMGLVGRLQFVRKYYLGLPFRHLREASRRIRARLSI